MSLIHDALRKAAEDQARREGRPLPARRAELEPLPEPTRSFPWVALVLVGLLITATAAYFGWPTGTHVASGPTRPSPDRSPEGSPEGTPATADTAAKPAPASVVPATPPVTANSPAEPAATVSARDLPREPKTVATTTPAGPAESRPAISGLEPTSPQPRPASGSAVVPDLVAPAPAAQDPTPRPSDTAPPTAVSASEVGPKPSPGPAAPKLIQTPTQVGQVGEDTFVLRAEVDGQKLELDFIVWGAEPFAQVNGRQVAVGQQVDGYLVTAISRDEITLEKPDRRIYLKIR